MFRLAGNLNFYKQCSLRDSFTYRGLRLLDCIPSKLTASHVSPELSTKRHKHQITYKPYVQPCYRDHDEKNMSLNRPMSPHLTIYAPTLPAMTSIAQRITGSMLTGYALLLSGGTLFLPNGIESYVSMIQSLNLSWLSLFLIKILLGGPFCFHYNNGIRYCMWTLGRMLAMKDVYDSSYKSMYAAAALTVLFAFL